MRSRCHSDCGQALLIVVAALMAVLVGVVVLGVVARGVWLRDGAQRAADLSALAGARVMHELYGRLFEPPVIDGVWNPRHLGKAEYVERARAAALRTAAANGRREVAVSFPDGEDFGPTRIRVQIERPVTVLGRRVELGAHAVAQVSGSAVGPTTPAAGGGYDGPLALRQGKPMRPDVALAFDRMAAAAAADGLTLIVNSGFRSDAEQQVLWNQNPDPRWVAPPGVSLHRNGTELDLGPPGAYAWLAANAPRFHFILRYPWEPWHFGMNLNASSRAAASADGARAARQGLPGYVPERFRTMLTTAAQRWNVSANLLAAQIMAESGFNPFATSPAGAQGIAQFMPGTAQAYGLLDPFDAEASINAQGNMMRDLLRQFGSVPLALAAYNAGPGRVAACGCVPAIPETQAYVARILGLMGGAGEVVAGGGLAVRLIE